LSKYNITSTNIHRHKLSVIIFSNYSLGQIIEISSIHRCASRKECAWYASENVCTTIPEGLFSNSHVLQNLLQVREENYFVYLFFFCSFSFFRSLIIFFTVFVYNSSSILGEEIMELQRIVSLIFSKLVGRRCEQRWLKWLFRTYWSSNVNLNNIETSGQVINFELVFIIIVA
jgi:hypothetical protein